MPTLVGMNHRSAPLDLRERAAFAEAEIPEALARLRESCGPIEAVILSTCNRTEILSRGDEGAPTAAHLRAFLAASRGIDGETVERHVYVHEGTAAVRHLFSVACGLDSMVLGEPQILGQLKRAYAIAQASGATGPVVDRLVQHALAAAKRIRRATGISRHAVSIASAAAHLARTIFDDLHGRSALLLGAGKMTELAARHLAASGVADVTVTNRTYARAETLAASLDGRAVPWDAYEPELARVDIVLTGTAAAAPVLTKAQVRRALASRRGRPLFIVDIAVPRDVEPSVHELPGVYLYDVDDLQESVDSGLTQRRRAAEEARRLLDVEVASFDRWRQGFDLAPTIAALYDHLHGVGQDEIERYAHRLASLTPEQRAVVLDLTRSLIQKVLHVPVTSLKSAAQRGEAGARAALYREIFGIDPEGRPPLRAIQGGKDD
jgi:glutamyl-tRNA reductase